MKLGIGSYTYTWAVGVPGYPSPERKLTALDLIQKAEELNVRDVQICDNLPLHLLTPRELLELKVAAEKAKIMIEVGTRGIEPDHLRGYLKIAKYLNSNILRVILHKDTGILEVEEALSLLQQIVPELEALKITLAIENHERHRVKDLACLVKQLNSSYVGICLDTVNSFGALEAPEQVIAELAPFVVNLHYKDFIIKRIDSMLGFEITGRPAGQGMLDCVNLKQQLMESGKDCSVILELWTPFTASVEQTIAREDQWAKESIEYLRMWMNKGNNSI
ncbi:MAG: sugar phosphate isomerase/epimerase [Mobilitalea sp.]